MLTIGQTISHYSVMSKIGRGGMGEVYQAKDTKLGRDVAIKVLPEEFARDADRVARFQREAKLLASLNHPNIAAIHGLEESDGTHFLVLELIEGETLSERLKRGPIPVEEALKLALQIAEALEAAHEKGVIHRDLKPANIKVTPDGKAKVLDFGLAKAYAGEREEVNLTNSPTLSDVATQQGVILGTASYMSPEQARGKSVDKRADIWAFGCVLFEMLTGRAVFSGKDVTDILAAVIRAEPEWSSLPANLHGRLREALERCLEKEARNRYSGISDARVDMQKVLADPGGVFFQPVSKAEPRKNLRSALSWGAAAVILTAIIAGAAVWYLRTPEPRQVVRFDYELPEDQQLFPLGGTPVLNISPDGKQVVYSTREGLYLRSVDELSAKPIPGSDERSRNPFFSPDGKSIAYLSIDDGKLKRIAAGGGAPVVLCDALNFRGGSWDTNDFIVYSMAETGIMRISSNGGTPENLLQPKSETFFNPQILTAGKAVLYTSQMAASGQARVMVKPFDSGEARELFAGFLLRYLPSGHIVYWDAEDNLCAVRFDPDRLEAAGERVAIVPSVNRAAVSDSGTLIFTRQVPQGAGPKHTLVWVDREGKGEPLDAPAHPYKQPRISPDGTRVAIVIGNDTNEDIWIWDIARKNLKKLTIDETRELQPVWTADSKRIIYWSTHEQLSQGGIYWRAADGSGTVEKLIFASDRALMPWSVSGDGKILLIQELVSTSNADIGMLSMEGDHDRRSLLQNKYSEAMPRISPDGRWMAYCSSESTGEAFETEIYIRPIPDVEEVKEQVSTGGGSSPLWSPDGRELFYLSRDNSVMAVSVKTEPTLILGTPRTLFRSTYHGLTVESAHPWDMHPDGKRFLMIKLPSGAAEGDTPAGPRKITVVLNWLEELKQRVPVQ